MATTKTIKKAAVTKTVAKTAAKPAATTTALQTVPAPAADSGALTIIVVDDKGQPVSGARVSIEPGSVAGATDASGQYIFKLGSYPKYQITAAYGSNSATVPYYVTAGGATRLIVNPVYVNALQNQRSNSSMFGIAKGAGIAIAVAVVVVVVWKFFAARRE